MMANCTRISFKIPLAFYLKASPPSFTIFFHFFFIDVQIRSILTGFGAGD